jgi:SAM-dependent methyltransferase
MTVLDFERRYRLDPDPWSYRTSDYERAKYAATLGACGPGPFQCALELGGSIGIFSAQLAPRCRSLTTIDLSPTAVRLAQRELAGTPQARAMVGRIPDDMPVGPFDLVVASEVLYYLDADALVATLESLERRMLPGARFVCVHWRRHGPERPLSAAEVHGYVRSRPWLAHRFSASSGEYLLDALERR